METFGQNTGSPAIDSKFQILRITVKSVNIKSSRKSEERFASFEIQVV